MPRQPQQPLVHPAFMPPVIRASNAPHLGNSSDIASLDGTDIEPIANPQAQIASDVVGMRLNDNFLQLQLPDGFDTQSHTVEIDRSFVNKHECDESIMSKRQKRYTHH